MARLLSSINLLTTIENVALGSSVVFPAGAIVKAQAFSRSAEVAGTTSYADYLDTTYVKLLGSTDSKLILLLNASGRNSVSVNTYHYVNITSKVSGTYTQIAENTFWDASHSSDTSPREASFNLPVGPLETTAYGAGSLNFICRQKHESGYNVADIWNMWFQVLEVVI
jgi:hypothetical protein